MDLTQNVDIEEGDKSIPNFAFTIVILDSLFQKGLPGEAERCLHLEHYQRT